MVVYKIIAYCLTISTLTVILAMRFDNLTRDVYFKNMIFTSYFVYFFLMYTSFSCAGNNEYPFRIIYITAESYTMAFIRE